MNRKEIIYQYIKNLPLGRTFSAQEIANHLTLDRANVSSDLNALEKQNLLQKRGTRPVLFSLVETEPLLYLDLFSQKNNSLKNCIEQAKAAALYPPQRMHILLDGQTGVGKSMFAEMIYHFSQQQELIPPTAKLITFNCADYASNPQLILGQLFGVIEGAYTGAIEARKGLIEEADEGILFLDEVHRLSPDAQEMLFTFIDKKVFHRLGETTFDRTANVQLICATTEEIHSTLLQTFIRRIPMKIHLPTLKERGLTERLTLITDFFTDEAHKLTRNIKLSMNSLRALLGYHCTNNIGQLKTDIQLLCAQSYARSLSAHEEVLMITSYDLPEYIKEGLYISEERNALWKLTASYSTRFIDFQIHSDPEKQPAFSFTENETHDIYQLIDHKMTDMEKIGLNAQATNEVVDMTIKEFFQSLENQETESHENIINLVGHEVFITTQRFLAATATHTNEYSESIVAGLAIHLHNMVLRMRKGEIIRNPKLTEIQQSHAYYYQLAEKHKKIIEDALAITLPTDEVAFLALFLVPQITEQVAEKVKILVVAHGESTASSMANVVNDLLGNQAVVAFNMPLSCKPKNILLEIEAYLKQSYWKSVLILADMGSLTNFATELMAKTDCEVVCIDLVSTLHVLEASRKAQLGYSLEEITTGIQAITHLEKKTTEPLPTTKKSFIVTACTTGSGSARLIKNLLSKQLNLYDDFLTIHSFQIVDESALEKELACLKKEGEILCYVSTFQISSLHCPYFNISQAFDATSLEQMQQLIDFDFVSTLAIQNTAPIIQTLDGAILLQNLKNWLIMIENNFDLQLSPELKIGLMCHLASVIDQLKLSGTTHTEASIVLATEKEYELYQELHSLELIYGVTFSQTNLEHIFTYLLKRKIKI
ncbi:sigma-54-dependent transcriptional regulator [Enterococcus sp. LJL99]